MKILVTGGGGNIGSVVARDFIEHGHQVRIFERATVPEDLRASCEVVYGDLTDRLEVLNAMQGCEAVAHLGAIPNPMGGKELELFAPNVLGTQNMFAAAEALGISRVAIASSVSIYGIPFQKSGEVEFQSLPIDEDHPVLYEDVYALSKQCNEVTAAMYTRRTGMATTCMRIAMAVTLEESRRWVHWIKNGSQYRSSDLWSYIDCRDVASAFRMALEKLETGHHVLQLAAQDVLSTAPKRELIERHYPQLVPFLDNGFDYEKYGFWSTERAERLLGWKSNYHWRDVLNEDGSELTVTP